MGKWIKSWNYVPINWGIMTDALENITQKVHIRNNLNGTAIKIKFQNLYDTEPLILEKVTVGKMDRRMKEVTSIIPVTYQGDSGITVPAGTAFYSDAVSLNLKESDDLIISLYIHDRHEFYGVCQTWNAGSWQSTFFAGDQTEDETIHGMSTVEAMQFFGYDATPCNAAVGICSIQVMTEDDVVTMACFGDSITHMSYYFDPLMESLYRSYPGKITLLNCGIGGNRLLYDECYAGEVPGHGICFGKAGVKRFEQDVYTDTVPDIIFFMEGVNDCTHGFAFHASKEVPTGDKLFDGLRKVIDLAHQKGSRIYVSTVMPFGCYEEAFREQAENIRQKFNTLIRANSDIADGFIDLDMKLRKPEDMHFMRDGLHLGDGVHPNEAGGAVIAETIFEHLKSGETL